jgi:crossover junction endodeoxyribonuclease RuvC
LAKILGIDPGLQITGWGIVDFDGYRLKHISHGTIASKSSECIEDRLSRIFTGLSNVIETSFPQEVSIERVFVNSNPISSLKLGMARGVAICVPGIFKLKVFEYMPNKVKKTVVGVGHASKDQIAMMVQKLLNLDCKTIKLDAADALAIAICHAHNRATYQVEQAVK